MKSSNFEFEKKTWKVVVEMPGIEPGAFHMQSERSTAELHPQHEKWGSKYP